MINILIVDDEPFIRQGLKILIDWNSYGYSIVGEASNGKEAIKFLENNKVDLIISDIKMPEMDGLALIKSIFEKGIRDIKTIMLSGYYEFEYAKTAIKYGVKDYILKPVEREELISTLISIKKEYMQERENYYIQKVKDKVVYDRYLNRIILKKYNDSDLDYVNGRLKYKEYFRYIDIEVNSNELIGENSICIKSAYDTLLEWLGDNYYNVILDVIKEDEQNGIGFIYSNILSEELNLCERQYLLELQKVLNRSNEYQCNLFIGKKVLRLDEIGESYESTFMTKLLKCNSNAQSIWFYDDIKAEKGVDYNLIKSIADKLVKAIEDEDIYNIENGINSFYGCFNNSTENITIARIYINYFLCSLIALIKEIDSNIGQAEIIEYIDSNLFNEILKGGNASKLKEFCIRASKYIKILRQNSMNDILAAIDKEICENYMENLTLKYLSEKYYLNAAYLGQLFKKNYNKSFKDYLNEYRIEKAASMLKRNNDKIYKIAEKVGYNNTDYFVSKFVQLKGTTPLQYRRQFRK